MSENKYQRVTKQQKNYREAKKMIIIFFFFMWYKNGAKSLNV